MIIKSSFLLISILFYSNIILASTVAIIDSGTDMLHQDIAPKAWFNPGEIPENDRDEDRNGYQDDIHGWNFAEGNNKVIDYNYLGMLTADIRKFFDIQAKSLLGTVTEEEKKWVRKKFEDVEFIKSLQIYGNFMHGTHVAGIAIKGSDSAKTMAVKLIPTEVKLPIPVEGKIFNGLGLKLIKFALGQLAKQQMVLLEEIAEYVGNNKADVANGSFGTGYNQATMIVKVIFESLMRRPPTDVELKEVCLHFLNTLVREGQHMVSAAPNTLFVFAAGNDGTDNDEYPTSPANIRAHNSITVAATVGRGEIAVFSNYGKKSVDVAAPGVAIESAAPGNKYITVSGTSQAAPFVANIAAKIKDSNVNLGPQEIKKIIMSTVDKKDSLKDIVKSEGIVNTSRAVRAAELSNDFTLSESIERARIEIEDQVEDKSFNFNNQNQIKDFVLPLPSLFKL
jgi:subtilisin family serine protease